MAEAVMWMDMLDGGEGPRRGDIVQTTRRTYLVLSSRKVKRRDPAAVPRYMLWAVRWWQLEPEMRMKLWNSACLRGGQRVFTIEWYPRKKKRATFEQHMRRAMNSP
jgi:hypothetical protein